MFDRIDNVYADDPLLPLYPATKRAPDIPPESMPIPMPHGGRVPPTAAVPGHADPRGHRPPSYSRAPAPLAYAVPRDTGTATAAAVVGGGRARARGAPMRVPVSLASSESSYSRAAAAAGPVEARGYRRSMMQPRPGGWENSTVTAGGGIVRSRRLPPGPGPGPSPGAYPAGPARPPAMMFREGGRHRGYEVGGGEVVVGAWPQHHQQARRWRADDGVPPPSTEAPPASRRRVSEWADGRADGWS